MILQEPALTLWPHRKLSESSSDVHGFGNAVEVEGQKGLHTLHDSLVRTHVHASPGEVSVVELKELRGHLGAVKCGSLHLFREVLRYVDQSVGLSRKVEEHGLKLHGGDSNSPRVAFER